VLGGYEQGSGGTRLWSISDRELVQLVECALAEAEEALREDLTRKNQRRAMNAPSFVRRAREGGNARFSAPASLCAARN
jgi:hypothetical protein